MASVCSVSFTTDPETSSVPGSKLVQRQMRHCQVGEIEPYVNATMEVKPERMKAGSTGGLDGTTSLCAASLL